MKSAIVLVLSLTACFSQANTSIRLVDIIDAVIKNPVQFTEVENPKFTSAQQTQIAKLAEHESGVWGDTILEGDYQASQEAIRVDEVVAIYQGAKLVAYKMKFSLKAWDTGSCDLDYDALAEDDANLDELLSECELGRIYGSAYISADLQQSEHNWDDPEYFE
ncbi:hypothetical protein [Bdellovibrio sp. HCB274]|uniref:hypothetical protein n=1 Tax=Bdellovibrio sp. HCB274 TaxID=3394361 RepID=UPI0039B410FB